MSIYQNIFIVNGKKPKYLVEIIIKGMHEERLEIFYLIASVRVQFVSAYIFFFVHHV